MARSSTVMSTGYSTTEASEAAGSEAAARGLERLDADTVDFCQVFCSATYDFEAVLTGIRDHIGPETEVIGGASHTPFTELGIHSVGEQSVGVGMVTSDSMRFFTGIGADVQGDVSSCVREAARDLPRHVEGYPHMTAILIPDGLAVDGEQLTMAARKRLGTNVNIVGGGTHFNLQDTPVICNDQTAENALAVGLIASERPPGTAFAHGHAPIAEPHEVTKAEGTVVHELDGRPAWEVWKDDVREDARETFDVDVDELTEGSEEITNLLFHYQYGVDQGDQYKLRNPGVAPRTDGPLEFVLSIPEGTVMRLMANTKDGYVTSARSASVEALDDVAGPPAGAFVYDCGCRRISLGDDYSRSVDGMIDSLDMPLQGAEVFGEFCMSAQQVSGYHNTTAVVMVLPS